MGRAIWPFAQCDATAWRFFVRTNRDMPLQALPLPRVRYTNIKGLLMDPGNEHSVSIFALMLCARTPVLGFVGAEE